jgi:subtilisin family serine protease
MVFTKNLLSEIQKPKNFQTVPVIVELNPNVNVNNIAPQISQVLRVDIGQTIPFVNSFSMVIPTTMLGELSGFKDVMAVHFDRPMYAFSPPIPPPPDPLGLFKHSPDEMAKKVGSFVSSPDILISKNTGWIPTSEANKLTRIYDLHAKGIMGQGVKVWTLDTGVDITNPQLQGVIAGAHSSTAGAPNDAQGHGSWCASRIVGQLYTHPIWGFDLLGGAPECEMNTCKVLTDLGFGNTSDILKGMQMALDANADIISMSLGGEGDAQSEEDDLMVKFINKAAQTNPRTIFVIAAGNSGAAGETAGKTTGIPANAEECIAVGAWSILDHARSYYSSTGPTLQAGRIKPDIMADGGGRSIASGYKYGQGDIFSGSAFGSQLDPLDKVVDGFCPLKGTSMATPAVAAIMALWKQLVPELTARDVKAIFAKYGHQKNTETGWGLIDATWILQAMAEQ